MKRNILALMTVITFVLSLITTAVSLGMADWIRERFNWSWPPSSFNTQTGPTVTCPLPSPTPNAEPSGSQPSRERLVVTPAPELTSPTIAEPTTSPTTLPFVIPAARPANLPSEEPLVVHSVTDNIRIDIYEGIMAQGIAWLRATIHDMSGENRLTERLSLQNAWGENGLIVTGYVINFFDHDTNTAYLEILLAAPAGVGFGNSFVMSLFYVIFDRDVTDSEFVWVRQRTINVTPRSTSIRILYYDQLEMLHWIPPVHPYFLFLSPLGIETISNFDGIPIPYISAAVETYYGVIPLLHAGEMTCSTHNKRHVLWYAIPHIDTAHVDAIIINDVRIPIQATGFAPSLYILVR